jgi:hypothetical protein
MAIHISDYNFLPVDEAVSPAGGTFFQHYVNHWWLVHPEKGLAFYARRSGHGLGSPQCNSSEQIARMVADKTVPWEDAEVRLFPSVWVPISIQDYRD